MDRQNPSTERIVLMSLEHVVGKESRAWDNWWARARLDVEGVGIALYAALLSLGAPPAAEHLTQDLTDIAAAALPPNTGSAAMKRHFKQEYAIFERRWRRQRQYNKALNNFARRHGYIYRHKTQDPAQFRKLFAGFLHACKESNDAEHGA